MTTSRIWFKKSFFFFFFPPHNRSLTPRFYLPRRQVEKVLHRGQSAFQRVEVVKTKPFGSLLITDGLMQSAEDDEYVYHQSLVHPAMAAHPDPKKVFIAGGGEVRCRQTPVRRMLISFFFFSPRVFSFPLRLGLSLSLVERAQATSTVSSMYFSFDLFSRDVLRVG